MTRARRAHLLGVAVEDLPDGRGRHGKQPRGNRHPRWRAGARMTDGKGHVKVRVGREHPFADSKGYVYEHILVVLTAGWRIGPGELVHHRNEDPSDNRLDNLEIVPWGHHSAKHARAARRNPLGRFVPACVVDTEEAPF